MNAHFLGSARALACRFRRPRRNNLCGAWKDSMLPRKVRDREGAIAPAGAGRGACAPRIVVITICLTLNAGAATLQQRIDAAACNETIRVESGVHAGAIVINKSVALVGDEGAEIRGNGS